MSTTYDNILSEREIATILAALRKYQEAGSPPSHYHFHDGLQPLDSCEIDDLCEYLNCEFGHACDDDCRSNGCKNSGGAT